MESKYCPNGLEHQDCNDNECQCECHTEVIGYVDTPSGRAPVYQGEGWTDAY